MLRVSVIFFVLGVIAAFFAYGDLDGQVVMIAKTVFFVCVVMFVVAFLVAPVRRKQ
jgi:uncharacterized membrane protein YtjA (UPF0391 family)